MNTKTTLENAILAAMRDYAESGALTPSNPAIVRDGDGYCYQSALHHHDGIVWDLEEGLGTWTPEPGDDLEPIASACAASLANN